MAARPACPVAQLAALLVLAAPLVHAAPGDTLYFEDFQDGDTGGWTQTGGAGNSGVMEFPADSGERTLYTCCDPVTVDSPAIDLSAVSGAQVTLHVQRGAIALGSNQPETGEDLDVYFFNATDNRWDFVTRYPGGSLAGEEFNDIFTLDADYLNASFRVRIQQRDGNGSGDFWHLHEVHVVEAGPRGGLGGLCDDFSGGLDNWQITRFGDRGDAAVTTHTFDSAPSALAINGGRVRVESLPVDLTNASAATLTLWLRRGANTFSDKPESGEDFQVGYVVDDTYSQLGYFAGNGTPGEIITVSSAVPVGAADFRVRLDQLDGSVSSGDYWHVDDVCLDIQRAVDHFAIVHDGSGVNCQAEPVEIVAHDADHFVVENFTGSVTLATSTSNGDWSLLQGAGTLANNGNGGGSYAFAAADGGRATLGLRNTFVETVNVDVSDGVRGEDAGEDADLAFARAGFNFLVDGQPLNLPAQIAGKPSNVAPGATTIELQAIRTDEATGACEAAFTGSTDVELAFSCEDPATCAGANMTVNGTAIAGNPADSVTAFTTLGLDFGDATQDRAAVPFVYADAGRIRVHARKALNPSGEVLSGSSSVFTVRPFGFDLVAGGNPGAEDASGAVFRGAGEDFTVDVRAVGWQAVDDVDADGIPDGYGDADPTGNADLSDNVTLTNFGNESAPDAVDLSAALWQPSGGANPGLSGTTTVSGFVNGAGTVTVSFAEAGIVELRATLADSDYLGSGDAPSRSGPVGRFVPHHFDVAIGSHGCNDTVGMSYSGQPLRSLTVTARDASGGTVNNFDAALGFAKDVTLSETTGATGALQNAGISSADFSDGSVTVSATPAGVAFAFSGRESLPATVRVRATDTDGVSSAGFSEPETEIRSARLFIGDAAAPVLVEAALPLAVQTWTASGWLAERDDACTSVDAGQFTLDAFSGSLDAGETLVDSDTTKTFLVDGTGRVTLTPPGYGNSGSVRVGYDAPAWLEFDWRGSGPEDPAGEATFFDIFSTEEGLIDRHEVVP